MSLKVQLEIPDGGAHSYTVTKRDRCTFVQGSVPMSELGALMTAAGAGEVTSQHLARLAGATLAWGPRQAVEALVATLTQQLVGDKTGLERWLIVGQQGSSSLAMVQHLTGRNVARNARAHPHDADDLSRCVGLLDAAPELRNDLPRMASLSPQWAALVATWPRLEAMLAADWRPLNKLMQEVLEGATP